MLKREEGDKLIKEVRKMLIRISKGIFILLLFFSLVFLHGPAVAQDTAVEDGITKEMLHMMRDTVIAMKKLRHTPTEEDMLTLGTFAVRYEEIANTKKVGSEGRMEILRTVAEMMSETTLIIEHIHHSASTSEKEKMKAMASSLKKMRSDYMAVVTKQGIKDERDELTGGIVTAATDIMDVMTKMKHTIPKRKEQKRMDGMVNDLDVLTSTHEKVSGK